MSDVLARICAQKRASIARAKAARPLPAVEEAASRASPPRGFQASLQARLARGAYGLIAEIKKASPSAGMIRPDFDPAALARAYERGGAACLSVLTEEDNFQGAPSHLQAARAACSLPLLRKDFMLDPYQVPEARAMGADCILLIMAAVTDGEAQSLAAAAADWRLDLLVEVHDREDLSRALRIGSGMIGINNRNLKTLKTDLSITEGLAGAVPRDRLLVAESGLSTPQDLARMARAGVRCFLIGEALMRQADVEGATRALLASQEAEATP